MLLVVLVGCGVLSVVTTTTPTNPVLTNPKPVSTPVSVVTGDFNGDGKLDIAVVNSANNQANNNVSIFLGNGDGTFTPGQAIQTAGAFKAVVGDFNGDGTLDLAVIGSGGNADNTVAILLGKGDGTFAAPTYVSVDPGAFPSDIGVGDFNHDTKLDLVIAERGSQRATVLLGNGDGTFTVGAAYSLSDSKALPLALAVGDFNGDGSLDFAITDYSAGGSDSPTFTVMLGNGDGTFKHAASSLGPAAMVGAQSLAVGDFNGDGKLDLIWSAANGPSVLLGHGDGTFTTSAVSVLPAFVGSNGLFGVVVGDFNGDGKLDFIAVDNSNNRLLVMLGKGDGTFGIVTSPATLTSPVTPNCPPTGSGPMGIVAGDFKGNGSLYLAVANSASSNVSILSSSNDGTFKPAVPTPAITIPN
jgi:hypothetical protein